MFQANVWVDGSWSGSRISDGLRSRSGFPVQRPLPRRKAAPLSLTRVVFGIRTRAAVTAYLPQTGIDQASNCQPGITSDTISWNSTGRKRHGLSAHRLKGYQGQATRIFHKPFGNLRGCSSATRLRPCYTSVASQGTRRTRGVLVDFAEDLHNDIGIWEAYERYNTEFFGTALPLTLGGSGGGSAKGFYPDRVLHLLWVLYPAFIDELILARTHQDLLRAADAVSSFLSEVFSTIPKGSGVKTFLGSPNEHGWDAKRKLVWLGCHSFMFRLLFGRYMEEKGSGSRPSDTPTTLSARSVRDGPGWGPSTSWRESSTSRRTTGRTCEAGTSGTQLSIRSSVG